MGYTIAEKILGEKSRMEARRFELGEIHSFLFCLA
jgi:hypothetical protein